MAIIQDYIGIDDFKPKKKTDSKCRFVFSTSSADTYNRYKSALLKLGFAYAGKGEDKSDVYGFNNYILSTSLTTKPRLYTIELVYTPK